MRRFFPLLLLLAAAGPAPSATPTYGPAPMPDADSAAPVPADPQSPTLSPELYQPNRQFRGDAFMYGSTAQSVEEKSLKPAPGMALKVPLY